MKPTLAGTAVIGGNRPINDKLPFTEKKAEFLSSNPRGSFQLIRFEEHRWQDVARQRQGKGDRGRRRGRRDLRGNLSGSRPFQETAERRSDSRWRVYHRRVSPRLAFQEEEEANNAFREAWEASAQANPQEFPFEEASRQKEDTKGQIEADRKGH